LCHITKLGWLDDENHQQLPAQVEQFLKVRQAEKNLVSKNQVN
jgi:hypothetical protein